MGIYSFIIPHDNLQQAQLVPDIHPLPVRNLQQLYTFPTTGIGIAPIDTKGGVLPHYG